MPYIELSRVAAKVPCVLRIVYFTAPIVLSNILKFPIFSGRVFKPLDDNLCGNCIYAHKETTLCRHEKVVLLYWEHRRPSG